MERSNFNPQIGDFVRIRYWEDMEKEFGIDEDGNIPCRFSFTEFMKDLCGNEFRIDDIRGDKYCLSPGLSLSISLDMIEPIPDDEIDGTCIDNFLNGININK